MVLTKIGVIHFGDNRYQQYKDKIGIYSHLDHNDKERRKDIMIDMETRILKIKKVLNIGRIRYCGENAKKKFRVGLGLRFV